MIRISKIIEEKEVVEPKMQIVPANLVAIDNLTYTGGDQNRVKAGDDVNFTDKPCIVAYFDSTITDKDPVYISVMSEKQFAELTEGQNISFDNNLTTDVTGLTVKVHNDLTGETTINAIEKLREGKRIMTKYDTLAYNSQSYYSGFITAHSTGFGNSLRVAILPIDKTENMNNMLPFAWAEKAGTKNKETGEFKLLEIQ